MVFPIANRAIGKSTRRKKELPNLLRAVIFDFDGIIVDSEPLILKLTQEMAALEGWTVSEEEYYRDYLALDDRGIVEHLYASHGRPIDLARRDELVAWKGQRYQEIIRDGLASHRRARQNSSPKMARHYPLAIASGSLRVEIHHLLTKMGLREKFSVLATADDCQRSKPDPEVYLMALFRLRALPEFRDQPFRQRSASLSRMLPWEWSPRMPPALNAWRLPTAGPLRNSSTRI